MRLGSPESRFAGNDGKTHVTYYKSEISTLNDEISKSLLLLVYDGFRGNEMLRLKLISGWSLIFSRWFELITDNEEFRHEN